MRAEVEPAPERIAQAPAPPPHTGSDAATPRSPATATAGSAAAAPPVSDDEQQVLALLADLQRYATLPPTSCGASSRR